MPETRKSRTSSKTKGANGRPKRIVVKAGTSVLTNGATNGLNQDLMADLVGQISQLKRSHGTEILLVTSGAIAAGRSVIGQKGQAQLGRDIVTRQVLAAIGQGQLMRTYEELFAQHQVKIAQTLLTINDLSNRQSYLNGRNTLLALRYLEIVPVSNENAVVGGGAVG